MSRDSFTMSEASAPTPPDPPFARGEKTAQRNRDERAACASPTFHQPTLILLLSTAAATEYEV